MPVGYIVVLAVPRSVVSVLLEHLSNGSIALGHQRGIARKAGAQFHDHTGGVGVMITTGKKRRSRWRAKCRGMELVVANPCGCQAPALERVHQKL